MLQANLPYLVLILVLTLTHLVQGITGFGGIVLALPVLTFFFPLETLVPALVAANLIQTAYFAYTERKHLHRRHARSLIILSLAGLPAGYALYHYLPASQMKLALGAIVLVIALLNLARINETETSPAWPMPLYHLINFIGGFLQGALACGGPLLVIYSARMMPDKSTFRATMMLLWTVLNIVLCIAYTAAGEWSRPMVPIVILALPTIVVGTVLGQHLHHRIPQKPFRLLIYLILLLSGLILLRPLLAMLWPSH